MVFLEQKVHVQITRGIMGGENLDKEERKEPKCSAFGYYTLLTSCYAVQLCTLPEAKMAYSGYL